MLVFSELGLWLLTEPRSVARELCTVVASCHSSSASGMSDDRTTNGVATGHNDHPNGHADKEAQAPPKRSLFRALVQDFSPVWFTWVMNIGLIALLTHTCPYQFHGLYIISTILYVTALTLFVLFCIIMGLRFALYFKQAVTEISTDVQELCFTACMPISWMVLTTLTAVIVSNAHWGGHAFTIVAYVMWWISVAWTLSSALIVYIVLTKNSLTNADNISLAIILPAVATSTAAAEGGLICIYAYDMSARMAVPVIIVSFMLLGIGTLIAINIYTMFLQRILINTWLDGVKQPSLCLLLGPTGQGATAFLALGTAAVKHFPGYNKGTFLVERAVEPLHGACVMMALLLWGLGVFWAFYVAVGIGETFFLKQAKWSPVWYSTIFPTGRFEASQVVVLH